jgi:ribulose-phosphate 3-epimerase
MAEFRISPSLVSASLLDLRKTISELERSGVEYLHFDFEDGCFVPVMNLGTKIIADLRPLTLIPFDVHLMMQNPEWILPALIKDGANRISVHYEACPYPRRVLRQIQELGATPGLAFNPATPIPDLAYLSPYLSFLVILTTEPEVMDCPYLPQVLDKVRQGKEDPYLKDLEWVVDGGINPDNISEVISAGADTVVVGRSAFKDGQVQENITALRKAVEG